VQLSVQLVGSFVVLFDSVAHDSQENKLLPGVECAAVVLFDSFLTEVQSVIKES
jgi:hypothetical protein